MQALGKPAELSTGAIVMFNVWAFCWVWLPCGFMLMRDVRDKAKRRKIKLLILPTIEAIEVLNRNPGGTNATLHVTC